jgi:tetratricopeptide (TPR) repeat protein
MAKFAFAMFALLAWAEQGSIPKTDDTSRARNLVREARALCGTNCDVAAQFGAAQAKIGEVEASRKSFADAWKAAAKLKNGVEQRIALDGIARLQAHAGQFKDAINSARRLESRYDQAMTLGTIAIAQAETGDAKAALLTMDLIPNEEVRQRDSALLSISMTFSERRDFAGAILVLDLIPSNDERAAKIIARKVPAERLSPQERTIVDRARMKSSGLAVVADDQAKKGDVNAALQTARSISVAGLRDAALRRVACGAADSGNLAIAQDSLNAIGGQEQKELALVGLIAALARQSRFNDASHLVETIKDPTVRAQAAIKIAAAHAAGGDAKAVRASFKKATALTSSDNGARNVAFKEIVAGYLRSPHPELAEEFTHEINDPKTLSEAFQEIASADWRIKKFADSKRMFEKSRQSAENVAAPYQRCVRLRELATAQSDAGDREGALKAIKLAIAAAQKIEIGGGTDVIALTQTATTQFTIGDREGAARSFEISRGTAARYPDESYVAQLLEDVVFAQSRVGDTDAAIQSARRPKSALIRSCMLLGVANGILSRTERSE